MNTKKGIYLGLAILAIGSYMVYKKLFSGKASKEDSASVIAKAGKHSNFKFLMTMEADFLKAWVKAIEIEESSFNYNGKEYNTNGGTTVKAR